MRNPPLGVKFLFHQLLSLTGKRTFLMPWAAYLYLTFRCNLRCAYCDDGSGHKFPDLSSRELTPLEWKTVLEKLIPYTNVLMLSGGEPLLYKGILEVIRYARELGFAFVSLNTNGLLLDEAVVNAVDAIIISLDSVDRGRSDKLWNRVGASDQVITRLNDLSKRKHPSLMVNCVILPENLQDAADVLHFCHERGITFSAGPALDKTRAYPGLKGNPEYHRLLDTIIEAKRKGWKIAGTVDYFRGIRHFESFECNPQLVWRVHPDGSLVFPCSRRNHGQAGNLLNGADPVDLLYQAAHGWFFAYPCTENCPLSCYMDTSFMIKRPLGLMREGLYRFRTFSRGHRLVY